MAEDSVVRTGSTRAQTSSKESWFVGAWSDPVDQALFRLLDRMRVQLFRRISSFGLNPPQMAALRWIAEVGPVPMRSVADHLGCDASYLTAVADRLEELGFIQRQADPDDRRVKLLAATPTGRRSLADLMTVRDQDLPGLTRLTDPQRAELTHLIDLLLDD